MYLSRITPRRLTFYCISKRHEPTVREPDYHSVNPLRPEYKTFVLFLFTITNKFKPIHTFFFINRLPIIIISKNVSPQKKKKKWYSHLRNTLLSLFIESALDLSWNWLPSSVLCREMFRSQASRRFSRDWFATRHAAIVRHCVPYNSRENPATVKITIKRPRNRATYTSTDKRCEELTAAWL